MRVWPGLYSIFGDTVSSALDILDRNKLTVYEGETSQMDSRLTYVTMATSLQDGNIVQCSPCVRCAAELYSLGKPA